jgi:hypothetical protein
MSEAARSRASAIAGLAALALLQLTWCRGFDAPGVQLNLGGTTGAAGSSGTGGGVGGTSTGGSSSGMAGSAGTAASGGTGDSGSGGGDASSDSGGSSGSGGTSDAGSDYTFTELHRGPLFDSDAEYKRGWTSIMPLVSDGKPHLICYAQTSGIVSFAKVRDDARGVTKVLAHAAWASGFSHLAPYYIDGKPYFALYHPIDGAVNLNALGEGLLGPDILGVPLPVPYGLTQLLTFRKAERNFLFWYKTSNFDVRLDEITANGTALTNAFQRPFIYGIAGAAAFSTPQGWFALMFRTSYEDVFFLLVEENGFDEIAQIAFPEPFSKLTSFELGGRFLVLLYQASGAAALFEFDPVPAVPSLREVWRGSLPAGADTTAAYVHEQTAYVILSEQATGVASFYAVASAARDR